MFLGMNLLGLRVTHSEIMVLLFLHPQVQYQRPLLLFLLTRVLMPVQTTATPFAQIIAQARHYTQSLTPKMRLRHVLLLPRPSAPSLTTAVSLRAQVLTPQKTLPTGHGTATTALEQAHCAPKQSP